MSNQLNYGSWKCESCEDIFDAETQGEEIAVCSACNLECVPLCDNSLTFTFADSTSFSLYIWDGTKRWKVDPSIANAPVTPSCACSTKILLSAGCQCGGK